MTTDEPARLAAANEILAAFARGCRFEWEAGRGLVFCWTDYHGKPRRVNWRPQSRGSDYPSIYHKVPFGGTCCVATMELSRWVRGLPVRALGMWEYMCSKTVGMNPQALELAKAHGWPVTVPCVFCGRQLGSGVRYDHYDHDEAKQPGPGCCWSDEAGCRRKAAA